MSLKNELKEVWGKELEFLSELDPVKEKEVYKAQVERVNEIEKRLADLEKSEMEANTKTLAVETEAELKYKALADEWKNQKKRNKIEIAKIAVPITAALGMGIVSMIWEKTEVLTSTAGKIAWRDLIKFKI